MDLSKVQPGSAIEYLMEEICSGRIGKDKGAKLKEYHGYSDKYKKRGKK